MKKTTKKIHYYTGNHEGLHGLQDFLTYFKKVSSRYLKFKASRKLLYNTEVVIISENFFETNEVLKLKKFLKNYKGKKILYITEFIENNSFNNFSKRDFFLGNFIKKNTNLSLFLFKSYRTIAHLIKKYILKIIPLILLRDYFYNFDNDFQNYIYFKIRYENYCQLLPLFDFYLISHEKIKLNKKLKKKTLITDFYIKDFEKKKKIKKIFYKILISNNKRKISFGGELNLYRYKKIKEILLKCNETINTEVLKKAIAIKQRFLPKFLSNKVKSNFALHLAKSKDWKYSSPGRFYRLLKSSIIPVILEENFKDSYTNLAYKINLNKVASNYTDSEIKTYFENLSNVMINEKKKRKKIDSFFKLLSNEKLK